MSDIKFRWISVFKEVKCFTLHFFSLIIKCIFLSPVFHTMKTKIFEHIVQQQQVKFLFISVICSKFQQALAFQHKLQHIEGFIKEGCKSWSFSCSHNEAIREVSVELHIPAVFPLWKSPSTHWIGVWVGSRASLDILEKRKIFCPCQDSNPRPSSPQCRCYANYTTLAPKGRASTSSHCVYFLLPIHWMFIISQHESSHPVINLCLIFCIHTFLIRWYNRLEDNIFYFSEGCISVTNEWHI
jgi:hypothetical protein